MGELFTIHRGYMLMFCVGGALENCPNFQSPLLLMKRWDLLDHVRVVVDRKFEQKNPPGRVSNPLVLSHI
jgi:hypothetical protein